MCQRHASTILTDTVLQPGKDPRAGVGGSGGSGDGGVRDVFIIVSQATDHKTV